MISTRVGGVVREVLEAETAQARIASVVREALVSEAVVAKVAGIVREVLLHDSPAVALPWRRPVFMTADAEGGDGVEWLPQARRLAPSRRRRRLHPYLSLNS